MSQWPIVASMLHAPMRAPDGTAVRQAGPEFWQGVFAEIAAEGFDEVEISDAWLPLADLNDAELAGLAAAVHAAGMSVRAVLAARCSVAEPGRQARNVEHIRRIVDAASRLGASIVGLGFHQGLTPAQQAATWFWTEPDDLSPGDARTRADATAALRDLADHAAGAGIGLSLELYPGHYLGTADDAVRTVEAIDRPNVGLNPDLGNLVRVQGPIERWEQVAARTLPLANYWHVKNYFRSEDPRSGTVLTTPAPLDAGIIDYRHVVAYAVGCGYTAPILVEHYGGDSLTTIARSRDYLRTILPRPA